MDVVEYEIATSGLISGVSATIGFSVVSMAPKVAKGCCWISALTFSLTGCIWAAHAADQPMASRLLIGAAIGAVAGLALTWSLELITEMNGKSPPPGPSGTSAASITNNQGIVSQNQSGGTNTVNNHGPVARRLTPEQKELLKQAATAGCSEKSSHVTVTASNGNSEAQVYASDIVSALKAAGCSADLELPIPGLKPEVAGVRIGLRGVVTEGRKPPQMAQNVAAALAAAKIAFTWSPIEDNFFPDREFVLVIGME